MKKLLSFMMVLTMCITMLTVPAWASVEVIDDDDFDYAAFEAQDRERIAQYPGISPQWDYTAAANQSINIKNKIATAACSVTGYKGKVNKIAVYMYIQQKNGDEWEVLNARRIESDTWYFMHEFTYSPCPHGYTYRLKTSCYVYYGTSTYESFEAYSNNFIYY